AVVDEDQLEVVALERRDRPPVQLVDRSGLVEDSDDDRDVRRRRRLVDRNWLGHAARTLPQRKGQTPGRRGLSLYSKLRRLGQRLANRGFLRPPAPRDQERRNRTDCDNAGADPDRRVQAVD